MWIQIAKPTWEHHELPVDIMFYTCTGFLTGIVIFRWHVDNRPSFWQRGFASWLRHRYDTPFWHAKICNLRRRNQLFWEKKLLFNLLIVIRNSWNMPERTGDFKSLTWHTKSMWLSVQKAFPGHDSCYPYSLTLSCFSFKEGLILYGWRICYESLSHMKKITFFGLKRKKKTK